MMRNTEDVILDIKKLVDTKGYIYALCIILFDDFHFDLNKIHEVDYKAKLSIKECSLIIGFLVQKKIDFSTPASPEEVFILIEKTYKLMRELQLSFNAPIISKLQDLLANQKGEKFEDTQQERLNFFVKDNGMVEPILYAGDGVYDFQYLEYLESKYKYDQEWLIKNKGFEIDGCKKIVNHIKELLQLKVKVVLPINIKESFAIIAGKARKKMKGRFSRKEIEEAERKMLISATFYKYIKLFPNPPEDTKRDNKQDWDKFYSNLLDLFTVTPLDFQNIDHILVKSFFHNFSFAPGCNETYNGPGHFNILNSRPIIKLESGRYFIPINYLVAEAVYESPFYWMWDDKQYRNTLAKHRGDVGEEIAYNLLVKVFGSNNTYKSVIVETIKGKRDTDIDVLCLLGNKAVCVQVKSKKLTLTARRGDFDQLSKDFNAAIQDAYDQGVISREAILNRRSRFYNNNGDEIPIQQEIDEVYIMVLTTENYPSLVHQVHMMLVKDNKVPYPLVLSVFDLELLVHYLNDRYDFLYYVRQRIDLVEYFKADEELVYLGYHLSHKLCKIDGYNWATIENDFGAIIDRNYYPHKTGVAHLLNENDDPILNRWKDPNFDLFIRAIKLSGHPKATDIVFHLLDWSGNSRKNIVERMTEIKHISHRESVTKSIAIPTPPNFGLSYIALDVANPAELAERVVVYSNLRKYLSKCNAWLGMGSFSDSPNLIDFIFYNNESWEIDLKLENEHKELIEEIKKTPFTPIKGSKKIGRNDPCPCNSGKKYKKCCGR